MIGSSHGWPSANIRFLTINPGMQAVPFPGAGMNFSVGERGESA